MLTCCDVYKPSQVYFSKGIKKFNFRFKTIFTNCIFITITINFSYFLRVFEIVNLYLNLKSVFKSSRGCNGEEGREEGATIFLPCLKFVNNETRFIPVIYLLIKISSGTKTYMISACIFPQK